MMQIVVSSFFATVISGASSVPFVFISVISFAAIASATGFRERALKRMRSLPKAISTSGASHFTARARRLAVTQFFASAAGLTVAVAP